MIHLRIINSATNTASDEHLPQDYPVSAMDCFSPGSRVVICRPGKKPRISRIRGK